MVQGTHTKEWEWRDRRRTNTTGVPWIMTGPLNLLMGMSHIEKTRTHYRGWHILDTQQRRYPGYPGPSGNKTLRVSFLDTPSFDTPVVTVLDEGSRQKILIRQVFRRCIIVWDSHERLSSIPDLPYPGEVLGGFFPIDIWTSQKILRKRRGNT